MKIEMVDGQPIIDANDLGPLLGLAPAEVQGKMRQNEITSKFEVGEGDNDGRFRLTFYHAGKRIRLTCAQDGLVLSSIKTDVGSR